MDIVNSTFRYLGRDWNASYGVSWVRKATGSVVGSTFEDGFIGAFTDHAQGVVFRKDVFRDNVLYGLDPHSLSSGLTVEDNLAEGNGHHGIIFSDNVTGSSVRNNIVRNNRVNGIMMDASSDLNTISGNQVTGNRGDGIVMSGSGRNNVVSNTIEHNRVGVHVYGNVSSKNTIERNTVRGNAIANQGTDLSGSNSLGQNGTRWRDSMIPVIWSLTVTGGGLLCLLTWWSRRQRVRRVIRYNKRVQRVKAGVM